MTTSVGKMLCSMLVLLGAGIGCNNQFAPIPKESNAKRTQQMSETVTIKRWVDGIGFSFLSQHSVSADVSLGLILALPAGTPGKLKEVISVAALVEIDNLPTGHGFEAGQEFDVHWLRPNLISPELKDSYHAYMGFVVDVASVNSITVQLTPPEDTRSYGIDNFSGWQVGDDVVLSKPTVVAIVGMNGDLIQFTAVKTVRRGTVSFFDFASNDDFILYRGGLSLRVGAKYSGVEGYPLTGGGDLDLAKSWSWSRGDSAQPFPSNDLVVIKTSNGSLEANVAFVAFLYNN